MGVESERLSVDEAQSTVRDALQLVGNTSANLSELKHKRILKALNPQMQDMVEEQELFQAAAPNLFGHDFETRLKERSESLKILSTCRKKDSPPPPKKQKFFRQSHSSAPRRGSGESSRGRQ